MSGLRRGSAHDGKRAFSQTQLEIFERHNLPLGVPQRIDIRQVIALASSAHYVSLTEGRPGTRVHSSSSSSTAADTISSIVLTARINEVA